MKTTVLALAAALSLALLAPPTTRAACSDAEMQQKAKDFFKQQSAVRRKSPDKYGQAMRVLQPELDRLKQQQSQGAADVEAMCAFYDKALDMLKY